MFFLVAYLRQVGFTVGDSVGFWGGAGVLGWIVVVLWVHKSHAERMNPKGKDSAGGKKLLPYQT